MLDEVDVNLPQLFAGLACINKGMHRATSSSDRECSKVLVEGSLIRGKKGEGDEQKAREGVHR